MESAVDTFPVLDEHAIIEKWFWKLKSFHIADGFLQKSSIQKLELFSKTELLRTPIDQDWGHHHMFKDCDKMR